MEHETIVAVYDTPAHADAAVRDLEAANVPQTAISRHSKSVAAAGTSKVPEREQGFWANLFGGEPDHDTTAYDRSLESGSTVVTVRVADTDYERVSSILEKHDPVDMDARAQSYGISQTGNTRTQTDHTAAATSGSGAAGTARRDDGAMQLREEELSIGKRAVRGGTTRIRRYTVEKPVEEQVNLRDEKVVLERRPVTDGRAVADADFADKTIEMTETREEAVASKTARVKEEVSLRKEATDRVETVKDTVRSDKVDVEEVPGSRVETETERLEKTNAQRGSKI